MKHFLPVTGCPCGKNHDVAIDEVLIGNGVIHRIPVLVKKYNSVRPFILADVNTFATGGNAVCEILKEQGIPYSTFIVSAQ